MSRAVNATAAADAPWYVIPADKKWFARLLVSQIVTEHLTGLEPRYPALDEAQRQALAAARRQLLEEKGGS